MRGSVPVALAVGLVGALLFASGFAFTRAVLLESAHGAEAWSGFALADPPAAPRQFEQPVPVEVEEPTCAPWISLEPDGTATACGEAVPRPPSFEAKSI